MPTNLDELKVVSRAAIVIEMIERTKSCSIMWTELAPGQYRAWNQPYEFYLTKTNTDTAVLDVRKHGRFYRTYNSATLGDVMELFQTVDILYANADKVERVQTLGKFLSQVRGCTPRTHSIVMNGGIFGNGLALVERLSPFGLTLSPVSLTFGPTPYPWVGSLADIDEGVGSHDGDTSYIRQQVQGALPTNWGYAIVGFDVLDVAGLRSPLFFNVRVAHRKESEPGVTLVTDVVVNNAVLYTSETASGDSYAITQSGTQLMPGVEQINTLQVRVSMFTNSGNNAPRVLRVSAVDLQMFGYLVS